MVCVVPTQIFFVKIFQAEKINFLKILACLHMSGEPLIKPHFLNFVETLQYLLDVHALFLCKKVLADFSFKFSVQSNTPV